MHVSKHISSKTHRNPFGQQQNSTNDTYQQEVIQQNYIDTIHDHVACNSS